MILNLNLLKALLFELILQQITGNKRDLPIFMKLQNLQNIHHSIPKPIVHKQLINVTAHMSGANQSIYNFQHENGQPMTHTVCEVWDDLIEGFDFYVIQQSLFIGLKYLYWFINDKVEYFSVPIRLVLQYLEEKLIVFARKKKACSDYARPISG